MNKLKKNFFHIRIIHFSSQKKMVKFMFQSYAKTQFNRSNGNQENEIINI